MQENLTIIHHVALVTIAVSLLLLAGSVVYFLVAFGPLLRLWLIHDAGLGQW